MLFVRSCHGDFPIRKRRHRHRPIDLHDALISLGVPDLDGICAAIRHVDGSLRIYVQVFAIGNRCQLERLGIGTLAFFEGWNSPQQFPGWVEYGGR